MCIQKVEYATIKELQFKIFNIMKRVKTAKKDLSGAQKRKASYTNTLKYQKILTYTYQKNLIIYLNHLVMTRALTFRPNVETLRSRKNLTKTFKSHLNRPVITQALIFRRKV